MDIHDFKIYRGRNIYSHRPVMKMVVDIGKYGKIPTKDIPGFNEKLLKTFPGLRKNRCGLGYEGGFLERLNSGTYLAHVLEHVILEMQYNLGYDTSFGKTRIIKEPSLFFLVYEYKNEVCGTECGKAAVYILENFLNNTNVNVEQIMSYIKKISVDSDLGPSTAAIVEEARKRNIPVTRIGHQSLIQLNYGNKLRLLEATLTDATSCVSADITSNKHLTKSILRDHNLPVPCGKVVYSEISAIMAAKEIGTPVVIKPFDGNQGKGVHLNLTNEEDIKAAFQEALKYSTGVMVEEYIHGKDYRILVVGEKISAVSERRPACVRGDGIHSIRELVEIINSDEKRGENHEKPLTKIKLDAVVLNVLKKKEIDLDYIPAKNEKIILRENANLSTGGTAVDCTDKIHPDNAEIAIKAAKAIGLDIAGVDVVTKDISESLWENGGAIVEVNASPGLRMHLYPTKGKSRNVAKDIINMLYPPEKDSDFPIVAVTGTNGKTTTVRMIAHTLAQMGKKTGMTCTEGTFINEKCISKGDNSGPKSAKTLLANKEIEAAVLECARGGIIREGLGYDLANVGVITNITDDHLGTDGLETLEDLAFVKALVAEAVKNDGYAVLNAEDAMTDYILTRVKSKVILFYKNPAAGEKYTGSDYIHVYADNGYIYLKNNKHIKKIIHVSEIPITLNGLAECNIENSLAAISALYGLKVPMKNIVNGLKTFKENNGRFHIFDMKNYKIMLDYAHNADGYKNVLNACKQIKCKRLIGIIGMPGDRLDRSITEVGNICSGAFDKIYIKEDTNLRGRKKGEVAKLLYDAVTGSVKYNGCDVIVRDTELDALKDAVASAQEGDLILVLYEKSEPLVEFISGLISERTLEDHLQELDLLCPQASS